MPLDHRSAGSVDEPLSRRALMREAERMAVEWGDLARD
jgi:hypothetical protein